MKKTSPPCFLDVYIDGEGKTSFSATRTQPALDTIEIVDGKEISTKNPDVTVSNEKLPQQFARNRSARRIVQAINRRKK